MLELLWRLNKTAPVESPRHRLRRLVAAGKIQVMPGVYDGLSARICELAGFDAVMTGPSLIGPTLLGLAEPGLVSPDQLAAAVSRMTGVLRIPLYVDAGRIDSSP